MNRISPPSRQRALRGLTLSLAGAALLTGAQAGPSSPPSLVRVSASALRARRGPSLNAETLRLLPQGQVYPVLELRGGWARLHLGAGSAWCARRYLAPSQALLRYVRASALNVRSGPSTRYRTLGRLPQGAPVGVTQVSSGWAKVSFQGLSGWVHAGWLQVAQPSAASPRPAPAPRAPPRPRSSRGFVALPAAGVGFESYTQAGKRWGTPALVYGIERAARRWSRERPDRMGVGDLSLERGGYFPPHSGHREGREGDFAPVRSDRKELPVTYYSREYSRSATRRMIALLRAEVPTALVLFNDPGIPGVQSYPGHDNHFHLRAR